ncbi:MAG: CCA tRNA nucleotidyltransferase [Candidatus Kariarchaeaceae archaeon]|jgi:tRNA nucleotidyltransferase (CCA-adding enzyme)
MVQLENKGHSVFIVGGSIRDFLNNQTSKDFDLATSATPAEIKKVFSANKILDYGEKHGTISILRKGKVYEITTFREEEGYSDGRRPDKVTFVKDLKSDLSRRDFTINALAADKEGKIVDYFEGLSDFQNKLIRAVGNPTSRIKEDSLRMLRAIRFSTRLGFSIEKSTMQAIKENSHLIIQHKISGERIITELKEILVNRDGIRVLNESGLLEILFPELFTIDIVDNLLNAFSKLYITKEEISWAVLFYYLTKGVEKNGEIVEIPKIMQRYPGLGTNFTRYSSTLAKNALIPNEMLMKHTEQSLLRWIMKKKHDLRKIKNYDLHRFLNDIYIINQICNEELSRDKLIEYQEFRQKILMLSNQVEVILPVNGDDAKACGYKNKSIGDLLDQWRSLAARNRNLIKSDFIEYADSLKIKYWISSIAQREEISKQNALHTDEETEAVFYEIQRISRLINSQDNSVIIGLTYSEMRYLNLMNLKKHDMIIVDTATNDPLLIQNLKAKNVYQLFFTFSDKNYQNLQDSVLNHVESYICKVVLVSDNQMMQEQIADAVITKMK